MALRFGVKSPTFLATVAVEWNEGEDWLTAGKTHQPHHLVDLESTQEDGPTTV